MRLACFGPNQTEDVHSVPQKVHLANAQPKQTEEMQQRHENIMSLPFQVFYIITTYYPNCKYQ